MTIVNDQLARMRAPEPTQIEAMTQSENPTGQFPWPNNLNAQELWQLLVEHQTVPELGLVWARCLEA